ncbi:hypothetical protein JX266_003339 [Neoarthrinium moseri]|nr:hypothetical protein JX266_003339 [Neoarthrinium moseri]
MTTQRFQSELLLCLPNHPRAVLDHVLYDELERGTGEKPELRATTKVSNPKSGCFGICTNVHAAGDVHGPLVRQEWLWSHGSRCRCLVRGRKGHCSSNPAPAALVRHRDEMVSQGAICARGSWALVVRLALGMEVDAELRMGSGAVALEKVRAWLSSLKE